MLVFLPEWRQVCARVLCLCLYAHCEFLKCYFMRMRIVFCVQHIVLFDAYCVLHLYSIGPR